MGTQGQLSWKAGEYYVLTSIKICQRFTLSSFRIPCVAHGSFFSFSLTSSSSSALKIKREPPSSTKGPPIKIKPSATSRSINSACSSQKGCSRVPFDKSRFGPAEEIATNVFFITGQTSSVCASRSTADDREVRGQKSEVRYRRLHEFSSIFHRVLC